MIMQMKSTYTNEKYDVAVVIPGKPRGGVKQSVNKLVKGLKLEGFHVKILELSGTTVLSKTLSDMKNVHVLRELDTVIYTGSIPYPSHIFVYKYAKTALFVHGFVKNELLNAILEGNLRVKT